MANDVDELKKHTEGMSQHEVNDFFLSVIAKLTRENREFRVQVGLLTKLVDSHQHQLEHAGGPVQ